MHCFWETVIPEVLSCFENFPNWFSIGERLDYFCAVVWLFLRSINFDIGWIAKKKFSCLSSKKTNDEDASKQYNACVWAFIILLFPIDLQWPLSISKALNYTGERFNR